MLLRNQKVARYADYLYTALQLIRRELALFKGEFWGKFIDAGILLFTTVSVFAYILPSYGLPADYGPFVLIGAIGRYGFFEVIGKVSSMIADMEGDRTILYTLSLPIPSWLVFLSIAVSWATVWSIIALLMFPAGKLILFTQFDLEKVSWFKLSLIFTLSHLFLGFFALWLCSMMKNISGLGHLLTRIINPMHVFGAWLYSWQTIYDLSPAIGIAHLINPFLYVMEGMRAAALGQEGYIPFWHSFWTLSIFTVILGWVAVRRLQKRMDCVTARSQPRAANAAG
jgi:ABC-2 type transport system permease protein